MARICLIGLFLVLLYLGFAFFNLSSSDMENEKTILKSTERLLQNIHERTGLERKILEEKYSSIDNPSSQKKSQNTLDQANCQTSPNLLAQQPGTGKHDIGKLKNNDDKTASKMIEDNKTQFAEMDYNSLERMMHRYSEIRKSLNWVESNPKPF